ncbi:MAG: hypothetical protein JW967_00075 [Dehalococcoidales bacterium]|nr:hypothetical protein [Dehalococcoidales bacterium]
MPEKRMVIVPAELVRKIDENRGDMNQADFIEFLIDSRLKEEPKEKKETTSYATKEELRSFEQDIKKLLKGFLDFFVAYGMELGKTTISPEFEELTSKLHILEKDLGSAEPEGKKATIKWK